MFIQENISSLEILTWQNSCKGHWNCLVQG